MCGICGILNLDNENPVDAGTLGLMVLLLRHRGPEQQGAYGRGPVGLGHARLGIVDIEGGGQPVHNEDKTVWVVYNGEIFNFPELRQELLAKGHRFLTKTDTEVLVHLYEEEGTGFLNRLNGQFAFALWDARRRELLLARDRLGVRPLYYTPVDGALLFASEIKALAADRRVRPAIDPVGLDQIFTFWATLPPRTAFRNIFELPPAHYLTVKNGTVTVHRYWDLRFPDAGEAAEHTADWYAETLHELLVDAVRIRLKADVPVAAFLSGGLDSSLVAAIARKHFDGGLHTFSVGFADRAYDERRYQRQMADFLGTVHRTETCDYAAIGRAMPAVVWHAEQPLVRSAPAPMYLLAQLVRRNGIKVVLTGEGADEMLGGYDLFKEMRIRRFWAKFPDSKFRPCLLKALSGDSPGQSRAAPAFLQAYYRARLGGTDSPHYSHMPRWETTSGVKEFYSDAMRSGLRGYDGVEEFDRALPADFVRWDHLARAQYIEMRTLLSGNLLSSQGDRMTMAHAVEGRYPFLDHRVVEFCALIPPRLKLNGMREKYLLKKIAEPYLPASIAGRAKQAYRAPDSACFFGGGRQDYVEELLSEEHLTRSGCFDPARVGSLVRRCRAAGTAQFSTKHNIAITGIITTLLLEKLFTGRFGKHEPAYQRQRWESASQSVGQSAGAIQWPITGRLTDRF